VSDSHWVSIWEGVHRAVTRKPGDLPAHGRSCPDPGIGRGTVLSVWATTCGWGRAVC